ncbi:protein kinase family protein [Actinidia rufa]|uniref:Protein kinase family protein n=1 Tax=Actinidia rufa TaxID=165716 RepID=A0A7J0GEX9_9ERIC|nr:protein kinase family protein [Actinidia rufa]
MKTLEVLTHLDWSVVANASGGSCRLKILASVMDTLNHHPKSLSRHWPWLEAFRIMPRAMQQRPAIQALRQLSWRGGNSFGLLNVECNGAKKCMALRTTSPATNSWGTLQGRHRFTILDPVAYGTMLEVDMAWWQQKTMIGLVDDIWCLDNCSLVGWALCMTTMQAVVCKTSWLLLAIAGFELANMKQYLSLDISSFRWQEGEWTTTPMSLLTSLIFAHTVLEMNYTEQQLTAAVVSEGLRPVLAGLDTGAPTGLLSLIQRCWDANPQNRPSFDDVVLELDHIQKCRKRVDQKEKAFAEPSIPAGDGDSMSLRTYQKSINWFTEGENFSNSSCLVADSGIRKWHDPSTDQLLYHPVLSWGSFATCGRRETMEDTHFLMPRMCSETDIHVFGIFDGHRGAAAAEFSVRALPGFLQSLGSTRSPSDALLEAFVKTDVAFRNKLDYHRKSKGVIQKDWYPGCTAIVALIVRNKLFVAFAGDCRAMLCRASSVHVLSKDHVASCIEERERVVREGGQVKWQIDTWRVGPAALQVTRSIGDDDLKPAVTAKPEITETILSVEDEYLVMASDGLWDVMSDAEVVSIIKDTVKEPGMCSKRLATEAVERGSKDNITVIVVFLRPVSTAERIY